MASPHLNPRIQNLEHAIYDTYYTAHGGLFKPDYGYLLEELRLLRSINEVVLSREYKDSVLEPFIQFLTQLKCSGFDRIFDTNAQGDLTREERSQKKVIEEVGEALLQRNYQGKYYPSSFRDLQAFQAVVTTIYKSFLDKEISQLSLGALAPLAKWGKSKGPCTFPITTTEKIEGIKAGIVNLPPEYQMGGLLAWASLGHEVGGHNFLRSFKGLIEQLQQEVEKSVSQCCNNNKVDLETTTKMMEYWSICLEEVASDVLGVMSIGPSFGIGLIGTLRGNRNGKMRCSGLLYSKRIKPMKLLKLSSSSSTIFIEKISDHVTLKKESGVFGYRQTPKKGQGTTECLNYEKLFFSADKHPIDILRPYVIIQIIELLKNQTGILDQTKKEWEEWIQIIYEEIQRDLEGIKEISFKELVTIKDQPDVKQFNVSLEIAIATANATAKAIAETKLDCFKDRCLMDVVSWKEKDEDIVFQVRKILKTDEKPAISIESSRHILAASILESLESSPENPQNIEDIFNKMKNHLYIAYQTRFSSKDEIPKKD
ncbi:MAG: hypothetical protein K940chlam8_00336 [Chlamydiae bacterium]|nr:hypothetical protein [Chlamydiota bacterium]